MDENPCYQVPPVSVSSSSKLKVLNTSELLRNVNRLRDGYYDFYLADCNFQYFPVAGLCVYLLISELRLHLSEAQVYVAVINLLLVACL